MFLATSDTRIIHEIRVKTANEFEADTIEEVSTSVCVDQVCCLIDIPGSNLAIGETYVILINSLGECYLKKFPRYSEKVTVTLKLTSSSASKPDGWLNEHVEIDFNNDETFACKNTNEWIKVPKQGMQKSKDELTLKCWKKIDQKIIGTFIHYK